jgi:predicted nucleotidyltransferase
MHEHTSQTFANYPDIARLLDTILSRMQGFLGEKLVGLYLYGSLVGGDFDYEISDIDLLAATAADIDEKEFGRLDKMHSELVKENSQWENRLEIAYLSLHALKTFKTETSRAAIISPGEPFHFKETGKHWLIDWYSVRENRITLFGPPPAQIIAPVSKEEFIQAVREQAEEWCDYINEAKNSRAFQAYAILTMCRALYAVKNGEQVSKKRAAIWAQEQLPIWSDLIRDALEWRKAWREENVDHKATFPETEKFVRFIIEQIKVNRS